MMHPYRCEICGETTLFSKTPERCPFCGSESKNMLPAAEWIDYGKVDMSDESYAACEYALALELDNYAYYTCAAENAENQVTQALFERLRDQEFEHAEVFADAMGLSPEELLEKVNCSTSDLVNMKKSNKHEVRAIKFYTKVANEAPEPRIKQIFRVIAEVEQEHLIITNMYLFR